MRFRGGEFSTGTTGNFQPELTIHPMRRRHTLRRLQLRMCFPGHSHSPSMLGVFPVNVAVAV